MADKALTPVIELNYDTDEFLNWFYDEVNEIIKDKHGEKYLKELNECAGVLDCDIVELYCAENGCSIIDID